MNRFKRSRRTRGLWSCGLEAAAVGVVGLRQEVRGAAAGAGGRAGRRAAAVPAC